MPAKAKPAPKTKARKPSLDDVMTALEKAGTAQARKIYARHGAPEPMFGVSFADLKVMMKRIGVDHELAVGLWNTGNFDARNLALKVVDPMAMSARDLDAWASEGTARSCHAYVAQLAAEGPHGKTRAEAWLTARAEVKRRFGWNLVGALAMRDAAIPADWFAAHLATIETSIHETPNNVREAMNQALIAIGCRDVAMRKAALASAKKVGPVTVDHGDTACRTPSATDAIEKAWSHAKAKGFESPAAQERAREPMRTRC